MMNSIPDQQPRRRKKTVTEAQLAANRANAKKSTGPRTEEGKSRSRYNSLTHGLTATSVVLPGESRERYDIQRHDYSRLFTPNNAFASQLMDELCAVRWMVERGIRYENALLTEAYGKYQAEARATYPDAHETVVAAVTYRLFLENSHAAPNLVRYGVSLSNRAIRVWEHYVKAQRTPFPNAAPEALCGAPTPYPEWPYAKSDEPIAPSEQKGQVEEKKDDVAD
ncbi:MAG: hypothetical protein JSU00_19235 [Acidobacteria bacterium]|nr:hypothetical protein [Acidobacteriota bacterium]